MPDYVIEDLDSCNIKSVKCERHHAKELSDFFTFKVPGHKFMPSYRAKKWDGQIKLYNMYSQKIYAGLESYIVKFCKDRNYRLRHQIPKKKWSKDLLESLLSGLDIQIGWEAGKTTRPPERSHPTWYERRALFAAITHWLWQIADHLYTYETFYEPYTEDKKVLVIVPTVGLVSQMFHDFIEYGGEGWNARTHCHMLYSGKEKATRSRVVISTWQSLVNMPKNSFSNLGLSLATKHISSNRNR